MLCFKVVLQLVFFFFKLAWASVTILGSKLIFWGEKHPKWRAREHNGWSNYARILYLFWFPKWLLYMLNCHRGVKNPDLPTSKIFIHFIVTLIQVLKRQTTGIFFQLIHHQKTSKSVTALIVWFGIKKSEWIEDVSIFHCLVIDSTTNKEVTTESPNLYCVPRWG